jgi:hypothetical protein
VLTLFDVIQKRVLVRQTAILWHVVIECLQSFNGSPWRWCWWTPKRVWAVINMRFGTQTAVHKLANKRWYELDARCVHCPDVQCRTAAVSYSSSTRTNWPFGSAEKLTAVYPVTKFLVFVELEGCELFRLSQRYRWHLCSGSGPASLDDWFLTFRGSVLVSSSSPWKFTRTRRCHHTTETSDTNSQWHGVTSQKNETSTWRCITVLIRGRRWILSWASGIQSIFLILSFVPFTCTWASWFLYTRFCMNSLSTNSRFAFKSFCFNLYRTKVTFAVTQVKV